LRTLEAVAIETPARRDTSVSDRFGGFFGSVMGVREAWESFSTYLAGVRLTRFSTLR
jgi:hypothetical protein